MIYTQYTIVPADRSVDARAAADACNRALMASGEAGDLSAAEAQIAECHPALREALRIEAQEWITSYEVAADRETGEWLGEPEYEADVLMEDWRARQDTDAVHFDTYEHEGATRAIAVRWQD